jgi:thiamine pyrophosphate-dependent acetolactate synthase large subunit-like protein
VRPADVALAIVATLPDALCVSSLGTATSALRSASDDGPHFYFGGAMGSALAFAMGVAEAVPGRLVVALLGDGELLMGASTLWSVSAYRPSNLIAVVLSDEVYAITGRQPLSSPPRFAAVAQSLGGVAGVRVTGSDDLRGALVRLQRPSLIEAEVTEPARPGPSPFVDPARVCLAFAANAAGHGRLITEQEPAKAASMPGAAGGK